MSRKNRTAPTVGASKMSNRLGGKPARGLLIPPPPPVGLGLRPVEDRAAVKVRTKH